MFNSLRTRVTITLVALAIIPLLLIGTVLTERSFRAQQSQIIDNQSEIALNVASDISHFIELRQGELYLLSDASHLIASDAENVSIYGLLLAQNVYDELLLIDQEGHPQAYLSRLGRNSLEGLPETYADDPLFQVAFETGETYYSSVFFDETTNEPTITISIPQVDLMSGNTTGVLTADFRFRTIWNLVSQQSSEHEAIIYVVDGQDRVIAHPNSSTVLQETLFEVPLGNGTHVGLDGEQKLLVSQQIQFGNQIFTVVSEVPVGTAFASAYNIILVTVVLMVLTFIVAIVLSLWATGQIVQPIEQLTNTAEKIANGDFEKRAQVRSNDEIGRLAQNFNKMTSQLVDGITNLNSTNRELKIAAARIKEEARLKSEFMSTMSHELRTPLNAIIGFAGIMLQGMGGEIDMDAEHMVRRIENNSVRLRNLINEILDLAKIEAGRMDIVSEPFNPHQLAEGWHAEMQALATEKSLDFVVETDPAIPDELYGDRERLTQIAVNLLSNAFKFTEEGGVTLRLNKRGDIWQIEVTDTGVGIAPHALNFIFDEFRQIDGSTRRVYGGSGLGLAIVRNLTRMMEGNVNVKSVVAQGSTFTVTLPLITQSFEEVPVLIEKM